MHEPVTTSLEGFVEECDCCHELLGLADLTWTGKQMLCAKCATAQSEKGTTYERSPQAEQN